MDYELWSMSMSVIVLCNMQCVFILVLTSQSHAHDGRLIGETLTLTSRVTSHDLDLTAKSTFTSRLQMAKPTLTSRLRTTKSMMKKNRLQTTKLTLTSHEQRNDHQRN